MKTERPEELIRDFNRTYTQKFNLLANDYLGSGYSLTEARALFEIANCDDLTPTALAEILNLDKGYVSRILNQFSNRKLITFKPSHNDRRSRSIQLTENGRKEFKSLHQLADKQASQFLTSMTAEKRTEVLSSFRKIRDELKPDAPKAADNDYTLRHFESGDLGTILKYHGSLYKKEHDWGIKFEGYVAETLADFAKKYDPLNERVWIAERGDQFLGSVAMVKAGKKTAQLRWLLVHPEARGLGLGKRLTLEVLKFAKARSYKEIILWTEQTCEAARNIYQNFGFKMVLSRPAKGFGVPFIEEKWQLRF
jgi:DNA-binding MarR family transcriptional regulator/GNAT superfamily N-acetyltransferase